MAKKSATAKKTDPAQAGPSLLDVTETMAPSVRKLVTEHNIDPAQIAASGRGGRLTKGDVLQAIEGGTAAAAAVAVAPAPTPVEVPTPKPTLVTPSASDRETRVPMTRLRQTIAQRLKEAQNTAAMLTTFNEVDLFAVNQLRAQYKESFEKKHGVKLGFMSFFVKACVKALKELPVINAQIEGTDIVYKNYYDIGIAVAAPSGLVVPVVRDADVKTFAGIEAEIVALGQKAKDGKLALSDMTGGTFSITNGGIFGSLMSTPILNAPQSAILGMHKIMDRPMVVGGEVKVRPMMYLALSYDHRLIDGKEAVTFLVRVKEALENPERMLLEI